MKLKASSRRQTTNGKSIVNQFRDNNDCSTSRKKFIPGRYVLKTTYRKKVDELKIALSQKDLQLDKTQSRNSNLKVVLGNYYATHNRKIRCDCGHCLYARKLVDFPVLGLRDSLDELKEQMERCWDWPK